MKITYSKSEPFKSGWHGWSNYLDVFLNGQLIGVLFAYGSNHRKYMEYSFTNKLKGPRYFESPVSQYDNINVNNVIGLRAAKTELERQLIVKD